MKIPSKSHLSKGIFSNDLANDLLLGQEKARESGGPGLDDPFGILWEVFWFFPGAVEPWCRVVETLETWGNVTELAFWKHVFFSMFCGLY